MSQELGIRLSGLQSQSGLEMPYQKEPGGVRIVLGMVRQNGLPNLGTPQRETLRHNPDECCRLAVEREAFAQDLAIAQEPALPKLVAHDKDRRRAGLRIGRDEIAPQQWFYP